MADKMGRSTSYLIVLVVCGWFAFSWGGCRTPTTTTPLPDLALVRAAAAQRNVIEPAPPVILGSPAVQTGWVPLEGWSRGYGVGPVSTGGSNLPAAYAIGTLERMLTLVVGTRQANWNGIGCWLGFAPQVLDGVLHVHNLDAQKTLLPLLAATFWKPPNGATIVIDPGHGGRDPGTRNAFNGEVEKHYTLDWGLRLAPILRAQGWKVILTRDRDVEVSLADRVRVADEHNADLFVSLHFNSAEPNRALHGIETYCLTPWGMPSTLLRFGEDDPTRQWPNNSFDEANIQLAQRMHTALIAATQAEDRGVRRARFMTVLREQQRPAILIEAGYLSNREEAQRIDSQTFRQALAVAVARGFQ